MATKAARGNPAPIASGPDQRSTIDAGLGDANLQPRGIGFGKVAHGNDAGRLDATYRKITTKGGAVYEVEHGLGRIPGFVLMVDASNTQAPDSHYSVKAHNKSKWNTTTLQVHVLLIGPGSMDGGEITLMIGGE